MLSNPTLSHLSLFLNGLSVGVNYDSSKFPTSAQFATDLRETLVSMTLKTMLYNGIIARWMVKRVTNQQRFHHYRRLNVDIFDLQLSGA